MTGQEYSYEVSRRFVKSFKKYPSVKKVKILEKITLFLESPYSPSLKTHKLTGELKDYWAFSIEYNLRIMFRFVDGKKVQFIDIGTHGIYK